MFLGNGYNDKILQIKSHNETIKRIENFGGVEKHYYEGIGHSIGTSEKLDIGKFLNILNINQI